MANLKYKRVLLKLSGEAFQGNAGYGIDSGTLEKIARQIKAVREMGIDIATVIGGGNIFRGAKAEKEGMDRVTADHAGMLATLINSLVLQDALERIGMITRCMSAINVQQVAEPYIRRRALRHLEKGRVVIFACGIGNPYMTTDTAAALRAVEINAEVLLMAKNKVDGIYDSDPRKNPAAKRFSRISHLEVIQRRLEVMDSTALSLCLENKLPIVVFNLEVEKSIERAATGELIGTLVGND